MKYDIFTKASDASMSVMVAFPTDVTTNAAYNSPSCRGISITYTASPAA